MNIYKQIAKDLKEVNATPRQAHLAFVALGISGNHYLKYIDRLKAQQGKQEEDGKRDA